MTHALRTWGQGVAAALFLSTALQAQAVVISSDTSTVRVGSGSATTIVDPANVSWVYASGNAEVNVTGGTVSWLEMKDSSVANVSGGDIGWVRLRDQSAARITGATEISWLVFMDPTAQAEIVADNVKFSGGHLSGIWADGSAFSFWAVNEADLSSGAFNFSMPAGLSISATVPEPATWMLWGLGLGGLVVGARRRLHAAAA